VQRIPRNSIKVEKRQRSGELSSLRDRNLRSSIETKGLLHPIVVAPDNGCFRLVAGGRRLSIIDWLAEDHTYFLCNGETILPGEVPITLVTELLSETARRRAEFEENKERRDLSWEDEARALEDIRQAELKENPKTTVQEIAKSLAEKTEKQSATYQEQIRLARVVVPHLSDPSIKNARNINEAYALVTQKEEAAFRAELIKRKQALPAEITLIEGDMHVLFPSLDPGTVDLIIADPPYGLDAGAAGFRSRTVQHHNYNDTVANARTIATKIFIEGFRVTKLRANLFMFCFIDLWPFLQQQSEAAGWTPFGTPIVWHKSDSEGLAPWGRQGFRRTYEFIFYATKGQRGLISSPVDILRHNRVARNVRDYGAAKPPSLMRELIECSTIPNDLVLDPCCGSGATLVAAKESRRRAIGMELNHNAYNLALAKIGTEIENPPTSRPDARDL
jgi:DNA modification methylase/ParB-like chromosome segregation protein Spo0J